MKTQPVKSPDQGSPLHVVFLCTGNAARSVMAGAMLAARGQPITIVTAGTHVIEGQPMSRQTRDALAELGIAADGHRSRQVRDTDLERAGLVLAMAREHVVFVRRRYPAAACRTGTIRRICKELRPGPAPLAVRLWELELADVELEPWEDIEDPAGGDGSVFSTCASELLGLVSELAPRLG